MAFAPYKWPSFKWVTGVSSPLYMELWAPTYKWFLGPTLYFRLVCCSTLEIVDLQTTSESPLGDGFRYF